MNKRLLSHILVFIILLTILPFEAVASSEWTGWEIWESSYGYSGYLYPYQDAVYSDIENYTIKMFAEYAHMSDRPTAWIRQNLVFDYTSSESRDANLDLGNSNNNELHILRNSLGRVISAWSALISFESSQFFWSSSSPYPYVVSFTPKNKIEVTQKLIEIAGAAKAHSSTTRGQLEYINQYLIDNLRYGRPDYGDVLYTGDEGISTEEAIIGGVVVCEGYTSAVNDLCFLLGIPNIQLVGYNHTWNCVYVEGQWKMLDVTWNDTPGHNKTYFLVDSINDRNHDFATYDDSNMIAFAKEIALNVHGFTTPEITDPATPTSSTILVNGEKISFDAYTINGNNYFKLRDLAYILSGTQKQFEVEWDSANNAIQLTSSKAYTAVGGEMASKGSGSKTATPTSSKIYLDGTEVSFTAYTIDGNNYFKLRDIGAAFDIGVDWDGANNTIVIDTSKGYTPD